MRSSRSSTKPARGDDRRRLEQLLKVAALHLCRVRRRRCRLRAIRQTAAELGRVVGSVPVLVDCFQCSLKRETRKVGTLHELGEFPGKRDYFGRGDRVCTPIVSLLDELIF